MHLQIHPQIHLHPRESNPYGCLPVTSEGIAAVVLLDEEKCLTPSSGREGDLSGISTALGAYTVSFGVYQVCRRFRASSYSLSVMTEESGDSDGWAVRTPSFSCYHLVIGGSLLQSFSLFVLSFAKPGQFYQIFLSQGIGSGIAAGLVFVPSSTVLSHHFDKHLGTVMATVTSGTSPGGAVHPIMLTNAIHGRLGFANGVRARRVSLLVILNSSNGIGHLFAGLLANVIGLDIALISSTFGGTVFVFGMIGISTIRALLFSGFFMDFFSGIVIVPGLIEPMLTLLTPDLLELGVRLSIPGVMFGGLWVIPSTALGGLIGPPISGALLTNQCIWYRGAVFNGALAAVATVMLLIMKVIVDRQKRYMMR
ncbi:hypothetical protein BU15DRAFT_64709 [Melanogaster broomeanus]|nr:hypothetical protein BU15DRAFT_64709 [Melanogaster broomeanus]